VKLIAPNMFAFFTNGLKKFTSDNNPTKLKKIIKKNYLKHLAAKIT